MEHPFSDQPGLIALSQDMTEHVGGGAIVTSTFNSTQGSEVPVPTEPTPIRPPIYTTLAVGEEGGVFPDPDL
ncbi:hypothetical protein [Aestuariibacter salexigens]|uniref:hypothetical protein n=1 Tax=Aestuariibacter salexigens TaxID=226010 RepID=UPI000421E212|nr:hypothetical protein [Aestuariibacter salexigens]